jgi:hypothetical protein
MKNWEAPDVELIADAFPGELIAENLEIDVGGNLVLAYLDIVAADVTPHSDIEDALKLMEPRVTTNHLPLVQRGQRVGVRFGAILGLTGEPARIEFQVLSQRALGLLRRPKRAALRARPPIQILVSRTPDGGYSFSLSEDTAKIVRKLHGTEGRGQTISIGRDMLGTIESTHGWFAIHLVALLTGLSQQQLASLGGVHFIDRATMRQLAKWPSALPTPG